MIVMNKIHKPHHTLLRPIVHESGIALYLSNLRQQCCASGGLNGCGRQYAKTADDSRRSTAPKSSSRWMWTRRDKR